MEVRFRPLKEVEIKIRVGEVSDTRMELIPYVSPRTVMEILDETVGPTGWQRTLGEYNPETGDTSCTISIYDTDLDTWVSKTDVGNGSDAKSSASDALKRAAVVWGLGRELYFNLNDREGIFITDWQRVVKWRIWKGRIYCDDIFEVTQAMHGPDGHGEGELSALVIKDLTTGKIVYKCDFRDQKQFSNPYNPDVAEKKAEEARVEETARSFGVSPVKASEKAPKDGVIKASLKKPSDVLPDSAQTPAPAVSTQDKAPAPNPAPAPAPDQAPAPIPEKKKQPAKATVKTPADYMNCPVTIGEAFINHKTTVGQLKPQQARWVMENVERAENAEDLKAAILALAEDNEDVRNALVIANLI